jgi:hypothetical protein
MKTLPLALLLLMMTECQIRYTESQLARQRGFTEAQRVPEFENRTDERCYSRDRDQLGKITQAHIYCYLLGDTRDNYTIVR